LSLQRLTKSKDSTVSDGTWTNVFQDLNIISLTVQNNF